VLFSRYDNGLTSSTAERRESLSAARQETAKGGKRARGLSSIIVPGAVSSQMDLANRSVACVMPATNDPRHLEDNKSGGMGRLPEKKCDAE
jgi:hypothetical protein